MLIYKIENLINNKIYIGQTIQKIYLRKNNYKGAIKKLKDGKKVHSKIINAMAKYGFENFKFTIIDTAATTQQELDEKEIYWISYYNSCNREIGYNIKAGGFGGGNHSEETKRKISASNIGKIQSEEAKLKISKSLTNSDYKKCKLNWTIISEIRKRYIFENISTRELGKIYGISGQSICDILNNKTWKE